MIDTVYKYNKIFCNKEDAMIFRYGLPFLLIASYNYAQFQCIMKRIKLEKAVESME